MIDATAGTVTFDGWSVGPGTEEPDFAAATAPHSDRKHHDVGDYSHHAVRGVNVGSTRFHATFIFLRGRLESVSLSMPTGTTGWADWSQEAEQRRKQAHDEWLESQLGPGPHDYSWGSVDSKFHPQSGDSTITVRYR